MKKLLTTTAVISLLASSLYASAPAEFKFGDVFKDLKAVQETAQADFKYGDMFNDLKVAQEDTQANFKFGDVFKDLKQ